MKATITKLTEREVEIEIPDECPACGIDLTTDEYRLTATRLQQRSCPARMDGDDYEIDDYDPEPGDAITVSIDCECGHSFDSTPAKLKTEINTPKMEERVRRAFEDWADWPSADDDREFSTNFEHGQWWVTRDGGAEGVRTFSVVDATGGDSVDGFSFEEV